MYLSDDFGRAFWVDDNNDLKSCPLKVNNEPDFTQEDYVEEWTDLEGLELDKLLYIYKTELLYKVNSNNKASDSDFNLTEEVYKEVKKCYNSNNLEDNYSYIDSLLTAGIWHGN